MMKIITYTIFKDHIKDFIHLSKIVFHHHSLNITLLYHHCKQKYCHKDSAYQGALSVLP